MKTIKITDSAYERICAAFGAKLKEARTDIPMTQAEFAEDIGYKTASSISSWEKGRCLPRARTLYHLAEWMGLSVDWLFGFSQEKYHGKARARKPHLTKAS